MLLDLKDQSKKVSQKNVLQEDLYALVVLSKCKQSAKSHLLRGKGCFESRN